MLRIATATLLSCALLLPVTSCFDEPEPNCAFLCGGDANDECPDGYTCVAGTSPDPSWCVRNDLVDDGAAVCSEDDTQ